MSSESRLERLGLSHLANDPKALEAELIRQLANDPLSQRAGINLIRCNSQPDNEALQNTHANSKLTADETLPNCDSLLPSAVGARNLSRQHLPTNMLRARRLLARVAAQVLWSHQMVHVLRMSSSKHFVNALLLRTGAIGGSGRGNANDS